MKKHRGIKVKKTPLGTIAFGIIFSFSAIIIISFIASAILMTSKNPTGSLSFVSFIAFLVAGAISGFIISRYKGDGGIGASVLVSLIFVAVMLAISLISAKGKVEGGAFMNLLCYMLISSFTAFLGRKREKKHHR